MLNLKKIASTAAIAIVALVGANAATTTAATAGDPSFYGTGHCKGMGGHSVWLENGAVRVAITNHTFDTPLIDHHGRRIMRTIKFKVKYVNPHNHFTAKSHSYTFKPGDRGNVTVGHYDQHKWGHFDWNSFMRRLSFTHCTVVKQEFKH